MQPLSIVINHYLGFETPIETACESKRKERMTSSHYGPYARGYTHVTMDDTESREKVIWNQSLKSFLVRIVVCNSTT